MSEYDDKPIIDDEPPITQAKWDAILASLYEWDIDDVLLQDQEVLAVQRNGRIVEVGNRPMELESVEVILNAMHKSSSSATLQEGVDHNFTYAVRKDRKTVYRFRVNATATMGMNSNPIGIDVTMRSISQIPPTLDQLSVPQVIQDALFPRTGIVIVGGATGSGKTTLLGAAIRKILTEPEGSRVLTYESPIEFDYRAIPERTGRIAQSDVYVMLKHYAHAASNALRRHPDYIVLNEARDAETIEGAIHNAETGHTVFTTVHVNSVGQMLSRMAGVFSHNERARALAGLIGSSRVLIYQELLPKIGGGRCAIREYLVLNEDLRKQLYGVSEDNLTPVMDRMVQEHGRPLIADVREHYEAGNIGEDILNRFEAEFAAKKREEVAAHEAELC